MIYYMHVLLENSMIITKEGISWKPILFIYITWT